MNTKTAPTAPPSGGSRLTKVLMAQYKDIMENPHPNLLAWMEPNDMRVWFFLIVGLEAPFLGGEYLFKLTSPDDFPHAPPAFEFLTPNGLYTPGGKICISIGEFHADDEPGKDGAHGWRASLGMKGFAIQVVNGLINYDCLESGVRIENVPVPMKVMNARSSRLYNTRAYPELMAAFEGLITASPHEEPCWNATAGRLRLEGKPAPPRPQRAAAPKPPGAAPRGTPPVKAPTAPGVAVSSAIHVDDTVAVSGTGVPARPTRQDPSRQIPAPAATPPAAVAPPAAVSAAPPGPTPGPRGDNVAEPTPLAESSALEDLLNDEIAAAEDGARPPGPPWPKANVLVVPARDVIDIPTVPENPMLAALKPPVALSLDDDSAELGSLLAPAASPAADTGDGEMDDLIQSLVDQ